MHLMYFLTFLDDGREANWLASLTVLNLFSHVLFLQVLLDSLGASASQQWFLSWWNSSRYIGSM